MGTLSGSMKTMLASRWSWQGVWGFGFSDQGNIPTPRELTGSDLIKVLRNRELWLISFLFGCFNFVFIAFITWAPTFLHQTRGSSLARASLLVSATSILSIVSCPTLSVIGAIAGWKAKIK